MQDWIPVVLLILIGLALVYVEVLFVPGTTFIGIVGLIVMGIGIYVTYEKFGSETGTIVLIGSFLVSLGGFYYSFKNKTWERFALKSKIRSKVKEDYTAGLEIAMVGKALSDLKPIGKAEFGDETFEVTTQGDLIESGQAIKIKSLKRNKIVVELT